MNLYSLSIIKSLLKQHNARLSKYLGQNFLISRKVLGEIIEAAELSKKDTVLEIGPGIGVLTLELAKRAKKVIAVEKDPEMVEIVKDVLNVLNVKNVEIVQGDILEVFNFPFDNLRVPSEVEGQFPISNYKVVANIPYYITSPVIRMFLEAKNKPKSMILMVQKEVAQRICAKPPKMSVLSVSVQFYAEPKIISYVSKKCFWPRPKVDSSILKISPFGFARGGRIDKNLFFKIVKAGFSSKRKFLANNLSRILEKDKKEVEKNLSQTGINLKSRAENLDVKDWIKIYEKLSTDK